MPVRRLCRAHQGEGEQYRDQCHRKMNPGLTASRRHSCRGHSCRYQHLSHLCLTKKLAPQYSRHGKQPRSNQDQRLRLRNFDCFCTGARQRAEAGPSYARAVSIHFRCWVCSGRSRSGIPSRGFYHSSRNRLGCNFKVGAEINDWRGLRDACHREQGQQQQAGARPSDWSD